MCLIGPDHVECLIEMSRTKNTFYIVAFEILMNKFHVVQMYWAQAKKILKMTNFNMEFVMKLLDFKMGRLFLKHKDVLLQYEKFVPELLEHTSEKELKETVKLNLFQNWSRESNSALQSERKSRNIVKTQSLNEIEKARKTY